MMVSNQHPLIPRCRKVRPYFASPGYPIIGPSLHKSGHCQSQRAAGQYNTVAKAKARQQRTVTTPPNPLPHTPSLVARLISCSRGKLQTGGCWSHFYRNGDALFTLASVNAFTLEQHPGLTSQLQRLFGFDRLPHILAIQPDLQDIYRTSEKTAKRA
jgi:hypothetical protein